MYHFEHFGHITAVHVHVHVCCLQLSLWLILDMYWSSLLYYFQAQQATMESLASFGGCSLSSIPVRKIDLRSELDAEKVKKKRALEQDDEQLPCSKRPRTRWVLPAWPRKFVDYHYLLTWIYFMYLFTTLYMYVSLCKCFIYHNYNVHCTCSLYIDISFRQTHSGT